MRHVTVTYISQYILHMQNRQVQLLCEWNHPQGMEEPNNSRLTQNRGTKDECYIFPFYDVVRVILEETAILEKLVCQDFMVKLEIQANREGQVWKNKADRMHSRRWIDS